MSESNSTKRSSSNALEVTVTELSGKLKKTVEDTFGHVRVRGEISGFRGPHSSGHCYFSLKDERARLEAVIWRGQAARLKHMPEEGLEVIASGKLTTYPGSSKYQIVIDNLEPAGAGALMALLEERRKKLAAEGLFGDDRKQLLPFMPKVVGVITSPTGAVIRDILHRLKDRFPLHVLLWPVRVQGETSGREVANGIRQFNAIEADGPMPRPDVIIVARGGGSLEDLWGFNDEILVRAAADSMIPVISAVGHETDWTLIDLAADWRAPTPTAAAERAVPVKAELEATLADLGTRLRGSISRLADRRTNDIRALSRGLKTPDMLLAMPRRQFDEAGRGLERGFVNRVGRASERYRQPAGRLSTRALTRMIGLGRERFARTQAQHVRSLQVMLSGRREKFAALARQVRSAPIDTRLQTANQVLLRIAPQLQSRVKARLDLAQQHIERNQRLLKTLSYHGVLERGFAVIRDSKNTPITAVAAAKPGAQITIEMQDGHMQAVTAATAPSTDRPKAKPPAKKAQTKAKDQGTLF